MSKKSIITTKLWVAGFFFLVLASLSLIAYFTIKTDPFFHYHKPNTDSYKYSLYNQRSQNDGIIKHFDYDAMIVGTSMTENFKTSDMDLFFGTNSIKVPYSGGTYKEINDSVETAIKSNPDLKIVVRGLDMGKFIQDKDLMREDLGEYPTYLYDNNIFNDVKYVFNRDVIFRLVYPMLKENDEEDFVGGITSFDDYSYWMERFEFGPGVVCPDGVTEPNREYDFHLSQEEEKIVRDNIRQNVALLAEQNPEVTFYCFFTPYSALWWKNMINDGLLGKQTEAERVVIEELLKVSNIKLYSFNTMPEITTDLNNYRDITHYASWINSLMLRYMKDEVGLLTEDNYMDYLDNEYNLYNTLDYPSLGETIDYENDYYAEELFKEKIY